jgi:hypothetical protein
MRVCLHYWHVHILLCVCYAHTALGVYCISLLLHCTFRPDVAAAVEDTKNGYDDTNMLPSETFDATEMMFHWARYNMTQAQKEFGLGHAETIVTLSGAHTVGHSKAHKSSPTSLG